MTSNSTTLHTNNQGDDPKEKEEKEEEEEEESRRGKLFNRSNRRTIIGDRLTVIKMIEDVEIIFDQPIQFIDRDGRETKTVAWLGIMLIREERSGGGRW